MTRRVSRFACCGIMAGAGFAACLASTGAIAGPNLVFNGSFEISDNGYSETLTPEGWTNIGHIDGVIAYSVFHTPPYAGNYFYDEGGYGDAANNPGDGIEQTVTTTPGTHYTLTFGLTSENVSGIEIADVTIGSQETQYTLSVDSSYGELAKPFTTETISYVATGASTTIAFTTDAASPSFGDNDPMIDGIIFSTSGKSVPEPATWTIIVLGIAGVGGALRLRRREGAKFA